MEFDVTLNVINPLERRKWRVIAAPYDEEAAYETAKAVMQRYGAIVEVYCYGDNASGFALDRNRKCTAFIGVKRIS